MVRRRKPPNPKHMWPYQSTPLETSGPDGNHEAAASSTYNVKPASPAKQASKTTLFNSRIFIQPSPSIQVKLPLMNTPITIPNSLPFKTAFGEKTEVSLSCPELPYGRTKQSFKADADINTIVDRFLKTGVLDYAAKNEGRYGDATGPQFQEAMNVIATANSMFAELPAKLRNRFENKPDKFFDFVHDPNNVEECVKLGLMTRRPDPVSPSHREDGSATHEPLRAPDGTYREHTRKEKRDEARAEKAAEAAKPISST